MGVREIYRVTRNWPKEEISRFAQNALGSAYELDTLLQIATERSYLTQADSNLLRESLGQLIKRISTFIRYQEARR